MPVLTAPPRIPVKVELRPPFWWLRWVPAFLLAVAVLYLIYIVGRVAIVPVLASFAIAYVINPIAEACVARGLARWVGALAAILLVTLLVVVFLWFVIRDFWDQSVKASDIIRRNLNEQNAQKFRSQIRD